MANEYFPISDGRGFLNKVDSNFLYQSLMLPNGIVGNLYGQQKKNVCVRSLWRRHVLIVLRRWKNPNLTREKAQNLPKNPRIWTEKSRKHGKNRFSTGFFRRCRKNTFFSPKMWKLEHDGFVLSRDKRNDDGFTRDDLPGINFFNLSIIYLLRCTHGLVNNPPRWLATSYKKLKNKPSAL